MNLLRTATRPSAESPSDHQTRVDRIVAQARADMAAGALPTVRGPVLTGQPVAITEDVLDRRLAEEIDYARRHLDTLGDLLSNNGYLLHKHSRELQSLDKVNQLLAHVARVISAANRRQAAASITLEDLRARLMRAGLAEEPAEAMPPIAH
jgi:hypothetical protein